MPVVGRAAWRLQLRGSATAALVISALASWGATRGLPAFADEPLAQQMLILQAFNVTVALTSLFLSAGVTERLRAERRLEQAAIELEIPRRGADLGAGGGDGRIGGRDRRTPRHGARPTGSRAAALRGPADGQDRELGVPGARGPRGRKSCSASTATSRTPSRSPWSERSNPSTRPTWNGSGPRWPKRCTGPAATWDPSSTGSSSPTGQSGCWSGSHGSRWTTTRSRL